MAEHVWPTERQLWRSDMSMSLAIGRPMERRAAIHRQDDITVISRDNMADALGTSWRTLIIDESSGFKDRSTKRWKAARKLAQQATYCWALTGTPSPNTLLDLWAQMFLLDGGEALGKTLTAYRSRYFTPGRQIANGTIIEWNLRPEAETRIHERMERICLSMQAELDLPPVTYNTVTVDLPPVVRKHYTDFKRDLVLNLGLIGGDAISAGNAAVLTGKLSQMSAGFVYHDGTSGEYDELHGNKIAALQEVIEGTGSPVLVFYHFRAERDMICRALPQARGIDEPRALHDWNAGRVPVLLAHPASAGHGLNLQHGGHTIVWTTLPWSLEHWLQGNARLNRQGQRHPVVIHTLCAENTVDTVIADRLARKEFTQDALLAHLRSPV